ncbi:MAG TPA: PD-(D/E)XK motif protein [Phycisphaerae bacterium]|nr:PD-(D/E)XK motif protein [Phycisphaerae bacterium]
MKNDPWDTLDPPKVSESINARRVDAELRWGLFWAKSVDDKCLFVIQHDKEAAPNGRMPRLEGIEVKEAVGPGGNGRILVFGLNESVHRDLFHSLCLDIVSCVSNAENEKEMVHKALARTWRWHHLLRGGRDHRLSPEEQKGLIGELVVLERHLIGVLNAADAVSAWVGPLGAPKDFQTGRVCIEVKTRRGGATPHVKVSSESQLDESGLHALFLFVIDLDRAPADSDVGHTLTDIVSRVRNTVENLDAAAVVALENVLAAGGFRSADDYSDMRWVEGSVRAYRVTNGFPRLAASDIPVGVSSVRYEIALSQCEPFGLEAEEVERFVAGEN